MALAGSPIVRAEPQPLDPVLGEKDVTYPDLQPDVRNMFVNTFLGPEPMLEFDTWSKNLGTVPLQVTAEVSDNPLAPNVSQCISWYSPENHVCREQKNVGGFAFHNEHAHFHYQDFATYTLRRTLADGTPDYSDAGVIDISEKVSFCLIDIVRWDEDSTRLQFYTLANCYAPAVMGISPGWADVYDATIPGQQLSVDGLADGRYALVVDQDPANRLFETDDTNNRVVVTFNLAGVGTMFPSISNTQTSFPTTGGTTTTSSTSTTTTTSTTTSTSTTSTTAPCSTTTTTRRGNGGGNGNGNGGGNGNGNGGANAKGGKKNKC